LTKDMVRQGLSAIGSRKRHSFKGLLQGGG
jgi:hypothetical protein